MGTIRRWGAPPFQVIAIHGGPGACGSLAPLAKHLARRRGVLEPFLMAPTIAGEIAEIEAARLVADAARVVLVGHSWGAWAALLEAVAHPEAIAGLVWIGAPPLEPADGALVAARRAARLGPAGAAEAAALWRAFEAAEGEAARPAFVRLARLMAAADRVDPEPEPEDERRAAEASLEPEVFRAVWPQAERLRTEGGLTARLAELACPVVVLQGEDDCHPVTAVEAALRRAGCEVRIHRFAECGHEPWRERRAAATFFSTLDDEIERLLMEPTECGRSREHK